jgi:hypothetical protein
MSTTACHLAQPKTCVDAAIASLVAAERNRLIFSLGIMAAVSAMLCWISYGLALAPLGFGLLAIAHHGLTRYRVRAGLFGNTAAECEELVRFVMAENEAQSA